MNRFQIIQNLLLSGCKEVPFSVVDLHTIAGLLSIGYEAKAIQYQCTDGATLWDELCSQIASQSVWYADRLRQRNPGGRFHSPIREIGLCEVT